KATRGSERTSDIGVLANHKPAGRRRGHKMRRRHRSSGQPDADPAGDSKIRFPHRRSEHFQPVWGAAARQPEVKSGIAKAVVEEIPTAATDSINRFTAILPVHLSSISRSPAVTIG